MQIILTHSNFEPMYERHSVRMSNFVQSPDTVHSSHYSRRYGRRLLQPDRMWQLQHVCSRDRFCIAIMLTIKMFEPIKTHTNKLFLKKTNKIRYTVSKPRSFNALLPTDKSALVSSTIIMSGQTNAGIIGGGATVVDGGGIQYGVVVCGVAVKYI